MPLPTQTKEEKAERAVKVQEAVKKAKVGAVKKAGVSLPEPWKGSELLTQRKKLFLFGHQGTGKTYFLKALLRAGHRIFIISTDLGGNGAEAIINEIRKILAPEEMYLLDNLQGIDLHTHEQYQLFFNETPEYVRVFDPTAAVLDGISGMQAAVDQYVLEHESKEMKDSEMRDAGLVAGQQDWAGIMRGTRNSITDFLAWEPNGHTLHKVGTSLQNEKLSKVTDKVQVGPLLDGKGRDMSTVGFGVVFQTFKMKDKEDGKVKFWYRFNGDGDKYMVKCRGYDLPEVMEADPEKVWEVLTGERPLW